MAEITPLRSGFLPDPESPQHRIWWELHGTGEREVVLVIMYAAFFKSNDLIIE